MIEHYITPRAARNKNLEWRFIINDGNLSEVRQMVSILRALMSHETGDRRQEKGDRRQETEDRRRYFFHLRTFRRSSLGEIITVGINNN